MGSRVHLRAGDPREEATTLELWGAGELPDAEEQGGRAPTAAVIAVLMVGLATFFVAFAPPA